jgi:hypothetical protein
MTGIGCSSQCIIARLQVKLEIVTTAIAGKCIRGNVFDPECASVQPEFNATDIFPADDLRPDIDPAINVDDTIVRQRSDIPASAGPHKGEPYHLSAAGSIATGIVVWSVDALAVNTGVIGAGIGVIAIIDH